MNILFLTLVEFNTLQSRNIYTDLLREFVKHGHQIYAVSPVEKRYNKKTYVVREENTTILRLQVGNIQKTNLIEKGISTIQIERKITNGIKKYFADVKFDLVLYSTPPITLVEPIKYVKKRDNAKTYLLLKDIFPQNAVDLDMMKPTGLKGFIYRYFRNKEKELYAVSDWIGCMSQANVDYVLKHNPEVNPEKVEVCPNSIEVIDKSVDEETRVVIRKKYGIPLDKKVFIYGGNLGKPQGIPFLIKCLEKVKDVQGAFFLVVGNGTEYGLLESYAAKANQANFKLMQRLPKEDYDTLVGACDVGMIFLDHRFTIPNFPSRLLSYMQAKLPVLAVTDPNTDIGKVIVEGDFGWWCESDNTITFQKAVMDVLENDLKYSGKKAYQYMDEVWNVKKQYQFIMESIKNCM